MTQGETGRISDDSMRERIAATREYSLVILKAGPKRDEPGADAIIWEHGRRNFALRAEGKLRIVCPVADDSDVAGAGIFDADPAETAALMDGDPAVQAGVLVYEVHPCRSFPGDSLA